MTINKIMQQPIETTKMISQPILRKDEPIAHQKTQARSEECGNKINYFA